ncbi:MAG: GyrI-like domain-containing protein [Anaerolineaceae bacterium]
MEEKLDLLKELKTLYSPSVGKPQVVDVPAMNFLMIDGHGDPNTSPEYADAISALYSLAYAIKFAVKKDRGVDFKVMPPEGLWWSGNMEDFISGNKSNWDWTMMILQPDIVTPAIVESLRSETARKKAMPAVEKVRLEKYHEGLSAQLMHVGPFADEGPNIQRLHAFIAEQGGTLSGKHHEIYMSDFRRTAPEKLRTIVRQPFMK